MLQEFGGGLESAPSCGGAAVVISVSTARQQQAEQTLEQMSSISIPWALQVPHRYH